MTGKLIFLDIDGTLTQPGHNEPPESALAAIREAQKRGHKVFLCSGRNPGMLAPLLKYGFDGYISCAGGYIGDSDLGAFIENSLRSDSKGNSEIERWRKALAGSLGIRPMEEYDGSDIYKVVIMCLHPEQLAPAREALEDRYNFCIQEITDPSHRCINGELINRKYDKGRAILRICEHLGVPVSDTVGFGDSMNDLEMIQTVGTSVCMANGSDALKKISDIVCPSVEEDGMAKAFAQLGLA